MLKNWWFRSLDPKQQALLISVHQNLKHPLWSRCTSYNQIFEREDVFCSEHVIVICPWLKWD